MTAATDDEGFAVAPGNGAPSDTDVARTFGEIDVDGDGSVSREELLGHFRGKHGDRLAKEDFDALFDAIDKDASRTPARRAISARRNRPLTPLLSPPSRSRPPDDSQKSGGIDFEEYASFVGQVQRMYAGRKALRSSMRVATLRESLLLKGPKPARRATLDGAPRRPGLKRRVSSSGRRLGMLLRARRFKPTRRASEGADPADDAKAPASGSVRWFDVEVREYGMTVSDNPSVRAGVGIEVSPKPRICGVPTAGVRPRPPLKRSSHISHSPQMSWDFKILEREHLDTFEDRRSSERSQNFTKEKMITPKERYRILREYGATTKEIQEAAKRATIIRNKRKWSVATQDQDQLKEDFETVVRLLKKISPFRTRRRKSKEQEKVLDVDERLHPTLMAMVGLDAGEGQENPQ